MRKRDWPFMVQPVDEGFHAQTAEAPHPAPAYGLEAEPPIDQSFELAPAGAEQLRSRPAPAYTALH